MPGAAEIEASERRYVGWWFGIRLPIAAIVAGILMTPYFGWTAIDRSAPWWFGPAATGPLLVLYGVWDLSRSGPVRGNETASPRERRLRTVMARIAELWAWLRRPADFEGQQWSRGAYHCPKCGQELPARRPGSAAMTPLGPAWLPPGERELVAKCPFDGRAPFNDAARAMVADGQLPVTRRGGSVEA